MPSTRLAKAFEEIRLLKQDVADLLTDNVCRCPVCNRYKIEDEDCEHCDKVDKDVGF